jgi:sporulation protein YlmC with PRC-barrel domain
MSFIAPHRVRRLALLAGTVVWCGAADPPPASQMPPQPQTAVAPAPAKVTQVRKAGAESLLGQPVMDANGDVFGNVVDVLIDTDGTPHAAVVEFTGFFGIGNRRVAVDWKALHFTVQQDHIAIHIPLDPAKLEAMPEYTQEAPSVPVATPTAPAPAKPH